MWVIWPTGAAATQCASASRSDRLREKKTTVTKVLEIGKDNSYHLSQFYNALMLLGARRKLSRLEVVSV